MRLINRFSRTFLGLGMLLVSAMGLGACGPDYALFNVHVQFKTLPQAQAPALPSTVLETIGTCDLAIVDEGGKAVLNYSMDNGANVRGCGSSGLTPADLGHFSYSTSRTSGTLTFNFVGRDSNRSDPPIAKGTASGQVKAFKVSTDQIPIEIYAAP